DAVVMVERTTASPDGASVSIGEAAATGDFVRRPGDDLRAGDVVVEEGTPLRPAHLGLLAGSGCTDVVAYPRARVGVLSTGDELAPPAARLRPGQIHDANRPTLLGLLSESGFDAVDLGTAPDDEAEIAARVDSGLAECDAILASGGVSMGDY